MKRITVLLSLVLVLALSMGAMAQFKLSGAIYVDAYLRQKWDSAEEKHEDWEFFAQGRRYARLSLASSGQSGTLKLILGFGNNDVGNRGADDWYNWTGDIYNPDENKDTSLNMTSAKIEATGALWKGGDSVTTTLGRHTTGYSAWVGHSRVRGSSNTAHRDAFMNSVEVKGLKVGPLTLSAAHGYAPSNADEPSFLHAAGNFGGIDTKVTAVNRQVIGAGDDTVWDLAAELKMKPMADLDLSGTIALDGQGQGFTGNIGTEVSPKLAFQADAKLTSIPAVTLTGSAWMVPHGFGPRYAQWDRDWKNYNDDKRGKSVAFTTDRQGFKVGAETTQAGVKLNGRFEHSTNTDADDPTSLTWLETIIGAGASTKIEGFDLGVDVALTTREDEAENVAKADTVKTVLTAGTKLADVDVKYTGTIETEKDMKNEIEGTLTRNLIFADNVKLNAKVIHQGDADLKYGADASWRAPNGLNFVVGYANYNKSGKNFVHKTDPDGFYIRAHANVNF